MKLSLPVAVLLFLFGTSPSVRAQWSTPDSNGNIYYNGGNVGINTATFDAKLHIEGDVLLGAYKAYISRYTTNNAYRGHTQWDHLQLGNNGPNLIIAGNTNAGGELGFVVNNTSDATGLYGIQNYNGAMAMYLKSNGNVGVGTTTPQSILDIGKSQLTPALRIGNSNYGTSYNSVWGLQTGAQSIMIFGNNGQNEIRAGNSLAGGYLDFFTNNTFDYNSATDGNFAMRLASNGYIGVGTTTPQAKLDVAGNIYTNGQFRANGLSLLFWGTPVGGTNRVLSGAPNMESQDSHGLELGTSGATPLVLYTNTIERLRIDGANGNVTVSGSINAKYQDVAEWVPSSEQLSAGTVVVLDSTKSNQVTSSSVSYDTRVAGVISEQPGIALGEKSEGKVLVATTGRVRVKVDATKGPIHIGDLLVTSDVPGMAMKSEPIMISGRQIHASGTLIGKALEPLEKGKGEILVLLSLQ